MILRRHHLLFLILVGGELGCSTDEGAENNNLNPTGGSSSTGGAASSTGGVDNLGSGGESGGSGGSSGGSGGTTETGGATSSTGGALGTGGSEPEPFELVIEGIVPNAECGPDAAASNCPFWPESSLLDNIGGPNISPAMTWGPGPEGTLSYAITMVDLSNGNAHWTMWDIPAATLGLPEDLPDGAMPSTPAGASQASFTDGEGWAGSGARGNVYELTLYALSVANFAPANPTDHAAVKNELVADADDQVLASTTLRARSNPNP